MKSLILIEDCYDIKKHFSFSSWNTFEKIPSWINYRINHNVLMLSMILCVWLADSIQLLSIKINFEPKQHWIKYFRKIYYMRNVAWLHRYFVSKLWKLLIYLLAKVWFLNCLFHFALTIKVMEFVECVDWVLLKQ